jgi:hypothetical protein
VTVRAHCGRLDSTNCRREAARHVDDEREREETEESDAATPGSDDSDTKPAVEDEVDEASDQSFPASDPPAY